MAFDAFLYFPKQSQVKGETLDAVMSKKHAMELKSFDLGAENETNIGSVSDGAGVGKATLKELNVSKQTDTASCGLFRSCVAGKHFEEAIIECRRTGADDKQNATFMKISMKMVIVKDFTWNGAEGDDAMDESLQLQYGAIKVEYFKQDHKGDHKKAEGPLGEVVWSQKLNEANFSIKR